MTSKDLSRGARILFEGHEARHFKLPKEVLEARRTLGLARKALKDLPPATDVEAKRVAIYDATFDAIAKEKPLPKLNSLLEARAEAEMSEMQRLMVAGIVTHASDALAATIRSEDDSIFGGLHTATVATIEEGRALLPAIEAYGDEPSDAAMLVAAADAREAWVRLHDLAARYQAIRSARDAMAWGFGVRSELDSKNLFGEFKNLPMLWPTFGGTPISTSTPPWPDQYPARLLWILRSQAEV